MPTFIVAYDALYIKGQDIRDKSVIDRRELLKAFILEEKLSFIKFSDEVVFKNFKDLEGKRLQCRQDLNYEGLMFKPRNSTYEPGSQKAHGLNLKETHIALTWFFYTPKEAMEKIFFLLRLHIWSLEWLFKK